MNKRNFVFNYVMKKSDFDNLQGDVEGEFNERATILFGKSIVRGLQVAISGMTATVNAGVALDGNGKKVELSASKDVDLTGITRPEAGKEMWKCLAIKHSFEKQGSLVDGNNVTWPERLLDGSRFQWVDGVAALAGLAQKPAMNASQVPLVDVKVDHDTNWNSLETESNRRPSPLPKLLDLIYPIGYIYAQYPGGLTPTAMLWPGTWEAQFESEGVFFRTPGGRASAFGSGIQEDAMQRLRGWIRDVAHGGAHASTAEGVFTYHQGSSWGNAAGGGHTDSFHFDNSRQARTATETRPKNRTLRVWKRTA